MAAAPEPLTNNKLLAFEITARHYPENKIPLISRKLRNDPEMAKMYVRFQRGQTRRTPLMFAALKGDQTRLRQQLNAGANIQAKNTQKMSAIDYAVEGQNREGFETLFFSLLDKGVDVVAHVDKDTEALLNRKDGYEKKYIHDAASVGSIAVLAKLLELGEDIDVRTIQYTVLTFPTNTYPGFGQETVIRENLTPLMCAAKRGHEDAVLYLLSKGANPTLLDASGKTVLHYCLEHNLVRAVNRILSTEGFSIKPYDWFPEDWNAYNAKYKNSETIANVFNLNKIPQKRQLVLSAIQSGNVELVRAVLEKGAYYDTYIAEKALTSGNIPILRLFFEDGGLRNDINWVKSMVVTFLRDYGYGQKDVVDLLLSYVDEGERKDLLEYGLELHKSEYGGAKTMKKRGAGTKQQLRKRHTRRRG